MKTYNIEELTGVEADSKVQGFLRVDNTDLKLPFTLISGKTMGKTVLITAGVHGAEYVSIETSKQLAKDMDSKDITGRIIIIHIVNTSAFRERLAGVTAEDGLNLNRVFPGREDGNTSEKLAYFILNYLSKPADFYIDMHGADLHGKIKPLIFYPIAVDEELSRISKEAAEASGFPNLVASTARNGSYSRATLEGTPSILTELGGSGLWSWEEVTRYSKKIKRILNYLGVYNQEDIPDRKITYFDPVTEMISEKEGFWYPLFKVGDKVAKNEKIGETRDSFDNLLEEYFSPVEGMILYQTVALAINKGEFITAISPFNESLNS